MEWKRQDVKYMKYDSGLSEKPEHFDEMVVLAGRLSAGFPFVRVDFYDVDGNVLVGEMTFYAGRLDAFYTPESFNRLMGSYFDLDSIPKEMIAHHWYTRKFRKK